MKKLLLIAAGICLIEYVQSQNVGIGTSNPQSTLDVKGNHRMGGLASYLTYDSLTGRIEWRNSNLYVPVTQALMKHSAAADGLFYNNTAPVSGQLEYRNAAGEPVFYTNFTNGNGYFKNNLGIGTVSPSTSLHIQSGFSNPVFIDGPDNLYLTWAENGIPRGYLGSYSGNPEDVDFGTYNGNTGKIHFTTNNDPKVTILNSGYTGIGTTNPQARLHVFTGSSGHIGGYYPGAIIEGNNSSYLSFYTPNGSASGIIFGKASSVISGSIIYDNLFDLLEFGTSGNTVQMVLDQSGNVGIGTFAPQSKLEVNGYTKLGSSAPKIQVKKLTGTTATTQGGSVSIAHGVAAGKILSVDVLVEYGPNSFIHYSYTESPGFQFNFFFGASNITIVNINGNSGLILSKPLRILITYEE